MPSVIKVNILTDIQATFTIYGSMADFISIQHSILGIVSEMVFTSNLSLDYILQPTYAY